MYKCMCIGYIRAVSTDVCMYVCTYGCMHVPVDGCMEDGKIHRYIDASFHASMHRSVSLCLTALSNLICSYPIYTILSYRILSYTIHLSTLASLPPSKPKPPHLVSPNTQDQLLGYPTGARKHIWLTFLQNSHFESKGPIENRRNIAGSRSPDLRAQRPDNPIERAKRRAKQTWDYMTNMKCQIASGSIKAFRNL